jgi:hypothetical protein
MGGAIWLRLLASVAALLCGLAACAIVISLLTHAL